MKSADGTASVSLSPMICDLSADSLARFSRLCCSCTKTPVKCSICTRFARLRLSDVYSELPEGLSYSTECGRFGIGRIFCSEYKESKRRDPQELERERLRATVSRMEKKGQLRLF